ncbi:MAG: restriction endonuclease subunit S [Gammaproteobacteria bacterium]|nr:restriction endonuclease subunit S [Gammaproteobacteria bacterium]
MSEWHTTPLGELTVNHDGKRRPVKEADRKPGPYPYYGASGIVDYVSDYLIDGDYLLVAEDGENLRTRQTPIAFMARGKSWVNNHAHIVTGNDHADTRFLMYAIRALDIGPYLTGAVMPKLTQGNLNKIPVAHPSVEEQRAIAHILGTLDDKIELNRRMNETLEAIARVIFKSWFVDFDPVRAKASGEAPESICRRLGLTPDLLARFPDRLVDSELGEIPEGWGRKPLSEICTLGRGASPRPINDFMNGDVPWIKIADATGAVGPFLFETKEKLKTEGVCKSVTVAPGDLILSNSATCGVPIFVEIHGCIHDGWLYFKNLRSITKLYLYHLLIELADHLIHVADGSVQKNLNTNLVGSQIVLVPPTHIVDLFETQASPIFAEIRQIALESRTLSEMRDALLPKLLSGELRVPVAESEVEARV